MGGNNLKIITYPFRVFLFALLIAASSCSDGDGNFVAPTTPPPTDSPTVKEIVNEAQIARGAVDAATDYKDSLPSNDTLAGFVKYTIPKGSQFSLQSSPALVMEDSLVFEVYFDSSAIYTTVDPGNQGDINKLFGFSDCSSLHQVNSARFGWRYYKGNLELFAYCYNNTALSIKLMGTVQINKKYTCTIVPKPTEYVFYLDNQNRQTMSRGCNQGMQYRLYPYFGGDETAPNEVNIWIKKVR